ncbi:tRNA (uracil(54)-C(5))-methyltransferase homolog-B [Tachysurus fulvidraco]|uniref:tRNA (uracil(54)-C(5))-methyltransferase homolog-B n=1 Tax=Tachysurus fulvidraco TaxID=1234273 RepID=UPI001FEE5889|nr:tRNA (uracil(54)-C(5))-methyltransferase homolog-B [Tachysurus fulvidraco]
MHLDKMLLAVLTCARDLLKVPVSCAALHRGFGCESTSEKRNKKKFWFSGGEAVSLEERLAYTVTPLWRLSYEEQLQWKQEQQHKILIQMTNHLEQDSSLKSSKGELAFPVLPIVPSPVQNGYRNKSTFSINKGVDGNPKTVGFYIGTGKGRNIVCIHGDHLLNIPSKHKLVGRSYEDFIRTSPLQPCLLFNDGGHWREITVRTNSAGNTMAIVYFHPQNLSPNEIDVHKESLVEYFQKGPGTVCQLDSLYFQESTMTRCSHKDSPYQLLYGEPHIYEEIFGLKFRISADAFFQVNRAAAEALYMTVGDLSKANEQGTLLDVCCGIGAIGITLSSRLKKVIGIELIEQAVEDAKYNAALNGIQNCEFLSGKAEVVLPNLIATMHYEEALTAVVNPSRAGLHYRVIRALRNNPNLQRLIYISCKPEGEAMRNFKELCGKTDLKRKLTGKAFTPRIAVPVDMFPHTPHCELVLVLER